MPALLMVAQNCISSRWPRPLAWRKEERSPRRCRQTFPIKSVLTLVQVLKNPLLYLLVLVSGWLTAGRRTTSGHARPTNEERLKAVCAPTAEIGVFSRLLRILDDRRGRFVRNPPTRGGHSARFLPAIEDWCRGADNLLSVAAIPRATPPRRRSSEGPR